MPCKEELLVSQDNAAKTSELPYLFTFHLTQGGLKFVSKAVFDLAFLALSFFKTMDSGKKLIETQKASTTTVSESLAKMFCASTTCKTFIADKIPICHRENLGFLFVKYLFDSVCRRKLGLLNAELPRETVHAGKTALMRTNPLVQNHSGK